MCIVYNIYSESGKLITRLLRLLPHRLQFIPRLLLPHVCNIGIMRCPVSPSALTQLPNSHQKQHTPSTPFSHSTHAGPPRFCWWRHHSRIYRVPAERAAWPPARRLGCEGCCSCQFSSFSSEDEAYALYPRITFSGSRPSLDSRLRLRARGMVCVCCRCGVVVDGCNVCFLVVCWSRGRCLSSLRRRHCV
jgi:hypothetical protein